MIPIDKKTWKPVDDVRMRYVDGGFYPCVCIKVHRFVDLRKLALPQGELTDPDFPAWLAAWLDKADARVKGYDLDSLFWQSCEDGVENMIQDAENVFRDNACAIEDMASYSVECYQDGRSGGWLYVKGLPEEDDEEGWPWSIPLRMAWTAWAQACEAEIKDLEYKMAWQLYVNLGFEEWAEDRDHRNREAEWAYAMIERTYHSDRGYVFRAP